MQLSDKQAEIMDSLALIWSRTSAVCANEVGKTSRLVCGCFLWNGSMFPRGTGVGTSGSWLQVKNQLMPNLHRFKERFPKWDFNSTGITGHDGRKVLSLFSTKDPGRAEGWHGSIEEPLMVLVDEAKSVPDSIFTALDERVNPQRYALFSSPGFAQGEFYRSQTDNPSTFQRFKITAYDCPHIEPLTIARRIAKRGIDDPFIRSAIFAEFMEFVQNAIVTLADWNNCVENSPPATPGERHAFVDFSGTGGSETVVAARVGNEVWIEDSWANLPEMASVGRIVTAFSKLKSEYGFRPEEIEGDADGLGGPMIGRLEEVGWPIVRFHGGTPADNPDLYFNKISETWMTGADQMKQNKVNFVKLWRDEDLRAQMMSRPTVPHSSGKIRIMSKEDMAKKNIESPDRADASVRRDAQRG
jgi:phage terminase large subunit